MFEEKNVQFLKSPLTFQKVVQLIKKFISSGGFVTWVNGKTGVVTLTKEDINLENVDNTSDLNKPISNDTQDALDLKIDLSEKAAINGVASLGGDGKVPLSQIPTSIQGGIKVIGFWNAITNNPNLSALTLTQGQAYQISVAGSTNLNGETDWKVKDLVVWDDSLAGNYFKLDNTDDVLSVNSKTGLVILDTGDISSIVNKRYVTDLDLVKIAAALTPSDIGVSVQGYDAETTKNNVAQQFTAQHNPLAFELSVIDNKISWNLDEAQFAKVTITSDTILLPATNPQDGGRYKLIVIASGGAQLKFGGDDFYLFNSEFPIITQDGKQKFVFDYDGSNMLADIPPNLYISTNPIPALAPNSWYNAKDYVGSSSNVTTLNDQGSNNFDSTKNGTGNIILSSVNGIDSFDFGSANNDKRFDLGAINVSGIMSGGEMTIIAVVKPGNSVNSSQEIFGYGTSFDNILFSFNPSNGNVDGFIFQGFFPGSPRIVSGNSPSIAAGKATILSWVKNAATDCYLYENSVQINANGQTQTESLVGTATNCAIAGHNVGGYSRMSGNLGEILIFNSVLSDSDRESIEQWLMNKFSI